MTTLTDSTTNAPRRSTLLFFVIALGVTWGACLPTISAHYGWLDGNPQSFFPLLGVAVFGPLMAALAIAASESGWRGVRALFRPLATWQAHPGWYVLALLLPGTLLTLGLLMAVLLGASLPYFYWPKTAPAWVALFVLPFSEEIGWRAFAFPRLEQRYGALLASLLLGVLWALWHLGFFLVVGLDPPSMLLALPYSVAGSVVFTWLYARPGGGLPLVILAHMGAHLNNSHQPLPGDARPFLIHTIGFCLLAALLVVFDRPSFRQRPGFRQSE